MLDNDTLMILTAPLMMDNIDDEQDFDDTNITVDDGKDFDDTNITNNDTRIR